MAKRIRSSLGFVTAIMIVLLLTVTYRQAFSDGLTTHPGNRRALIEEFSSARGNIFADDGAVLAESRPESGAFKRVYPKGAAFAPVTGYFSPTRGQAGLEAEWGQWLAPGKHFTSFDDWLSSLTNKGRRGFDLTVTVKPPLQALAWRLLGERRGAIVVLDPRTGATLALVSRPAFDPNQVETDWERISSTDGLMINRATQALYPPGSTFKIITAAAALEQGVAKPSSKYDGPAILPVYGSKVTNFADQDQGRMSFARAFTKSTNTIFAQVGLELGADRLTGAARAFGLNARPAYDLPVAKSTMPGPGEMDKVMTAWSAVGQGETLVTPVGMALVASAIAGDGQIFRPYLVNSVRDYEGAVRFKTRPRRWVRATTPRTARQVKKMMVATVESGTGRAAWLPDVTVAGKTGTAEPGGAGRPHAWFVGFAPAENPRVVVAVLVENGGLGGQTAAPPATELFKAALAD